MISNLYLFWLYRNEIFFLIRLFLSLVEFDLFSDVSYIILKQRSAFFAHRAKTALRRQRKDTSFWQSKITTWQIEDMPTVQ